MNQDIEKLKKQAELNYELAKMLKSFLEKSCSEGQLSRVLKSRLEDLFYDIIYITNKKV